MLAVRIRFFCCSFMSNYMLFGPIQIGEGRNDEKLSATTCYDTSYYFYGDLLSIACIPVSYFLINYFLLDCTSRTVAYQVQLVCSLVCLLPCNFKTAKPVQINEAHTIRLESGSANEILAKTKNCGRCTLYCVKNGQTINQKRIKLWLLNNNKIFNIINNNYY